MLKKISKPLVPISAITAILGIVFLASCKFSFAEQKRPDEGSISFGAEKKPTIQSSPQYEAFKTVFADVAEKVIPAVVSITSTKMDTVVYRNPFNQFFWGSPFEDFFNSPQQRNQPQNEKKIIPRTGVGSGVIVSPEGYILTNYHVVGDADEITVEMDDDRKFDAEIIGLDSLSDVAVIKIKEKVDDLPVAFIGNSDKLRPGDWVMAVGNPFNLSSTVTTGIVSALGRTTGGGLSYQDFIQTDAAINPGNSGGALVNIEGELIGINTMIYSRSGGYMGIGFAIPINMARDIMEQLIYSGKVSRGWLGVTIQDLDKATSEAMGLENQQGVLIGDVFEGQPAEKGGIKRGDLIISIDREKVTNTNELRNTVASIRPGTTVPIKVIRKGKEITLNVTIAKRDESKLGGLSGKGEEKESSDPDTESFEKLGFTVSDITAEAKERLNLSSTKGVVITDVETGSQAERQGIRTDDILLEMNQQPIANMKEFNRIARSVKKGSSVLFLIKRGRSTFFKAYKIK